MADPAGLALGLVGTWNVCVQAFDIVASGKRYGMDYQIARVKLGGRKNSSLSIDSRLVKEDVRSTVMRLLGCVEHVFSNAESLRKKYGLKEEPFSPTELEASQLSPSASAAEASNPILGSIFKRAYTGLRATARENQQSAPLKRKTTWAISDKGKFLAFIAEIRGFNDSLERLFPDMKRSSGKILSEIKVSDEIRPLQLLRQAAAGEHEEISETASVRLESLSASATTRRDKESKVEEIDDGDPDWVDEESEETAGPEKTPLEKELDKVDKFVIKKSVGSLSCTTHTGSEWTARCWAYAGWEGYDNKRGFSAFDDRDKGTVTMPHLALGERIIL
jgi:hypothetical protein